MRRVGQMLLCCAVCFLLVSCGLADMPRSDDIKNALQERVVNDDYTIDTVVLMEEYVYEDTKTAYQCCEVVSSNDTCKKTEEVELYYSYVKGKWQIDSVSVQDEADYELLRDLDQNQCRSLILGRVPSNAEIVELSTNRDKMTAQATIKYQKRSNEFGAYGFVTKDAVVNAKFRWKPDGWELTNFDDTTETKYVYDVQCHVQRGSGSTTDLKTKTFTMGFDVSINNNDVSISNIKYLARAYFVGTMRITNPRIGEESDEKKLVICFDYERQVSALSKEEKQYAGQFADKLKPTSGAGRLVMFGESAGNSAGMTIVEFDNWDPTATGSAWRNQEFLVERS